MRPGQLARAVCSWCKLPLALPQIAGAAAAAANLELEQGAALSSSDNREEALLDAVRKHTVMLLQARLILPAAALAPLHEPDSALL